ncbi:MAG TPA: glycosyltransferase [Bacteroidia bacterium]|nr:glycosyltransferase [Bacteroidia bacterium]
MLWYYIFYFSKLAFYKTGNTDRNKKGKKEPGVSVVICARNEARNISDFLPVVLTQDYPNYEVIVVDDCSHDSTSDILKAFEKKNPHLKVITIKEDRVHHHGKKFAVMVGIKGASHEYVLLTDADCRPMSNQWIRSMTSTLSGEKEIVLGFSKYERLPGFLNKMIRFDTFHIALQYLSFAQGGHPYMGVGRNLAYKKSLFFNNKGFASHYHIDSGDDDLFINEVANAKNTSIEIAMDSFTVSRVKKEWSSWFDQKRRHLTTWAHYKTSDKIRLGGYLISQALFWVLFFSLIPIVILFPVFNQYDLFIVLGLFLLKTCSQLIVFNKAMNNLKERDLLVLSILAELFLLVIYVSLTISNKLFRKQKWKKI